MNHLNLNDYLVQVQTKYQQPALTQLIEQVASSCQQISQLVRQGDLSGVLGSLGTQNVQGEVQKKLDVLSNDLLLNTLQTTGLLAGIASEEMPDPYAIPDQYQRGDYLLLFDPLDGSSNIDVNVSIGTIFSVLKAPHQQVTEADFLQKGTQQVAAGYVIYGPQTMLVLTVGHGVAMFTLTNDGQWLLTKDQVTIPEETQEFAINMSNYRHWAAGVRHYIDDCLLGETGSLHKNYNMRWIAAMVTDVHRILCRGGIFMYPWDKRDPKKPGKLRLMYEANPMSFLIEQAGGVASTTQQRILDIQPEHLHQRVSVCLGSKHEVEKVVAYCEKASSTNKQVSTSDPLSITTEGSPMNSLFKSLVSQYNDLTQQLNELANELNAFDDRKKSEIQSSETGVDKPNFPLNQITTDLQELIQEFEQLKSEFNISGETSIFEIGKVADKKPGLLDALIKKYNEKTEEYVALRDLLEDSIKNPEKPND